MVAHLVWDERVRFDSGIPDYKEYTMDADSTMTIGKWKGHRLGDIPSSYWVWFRHQEWSEKKYPALFAYAKTVKHVPQKRKYMFEIDTYWDYPDTQDDRDFFYDSYGYDRDWC